MRRLAGGAALVLAAALLDLVLILPNHPAALTPGALRLFPLELPAILLLLAALPHRSAATRPVRAVLVAALILVSVLKIADIAMRTAFSRPFNPVGDWPLAAAGLRLLDGTLGTAATVLAAFGALCGLALAAALLWWATGRWTRLDASGPVGAAAGLAGIVAAFVALAEIGQATGSWRLPHRPPGAAFTARTALEKTELVVATLRDLNAFDRAAAEDPFAGRDGLLDRIDRDVVVIFVESYGRSSIDVPFYAGTHQETLATAERRLRRQGLAMRSAYLEAPTRGGQSWLSHATLMNGLLVDSAARYSASLRSDRETLYDIAGRSGFRTAAVMPAITLAWPEGETMGFDRILPADALGYEGLPFDWVTMPDQFTLAALDRLLRGPGRGAPLFAQIALVSSHAPWTPVPELVDPGTLGDGHVFDAQARAGDPPSVVWRDRDRVREQYRAAIDYSLRAVFDWVARTEGAPLVVVIGDHPPARFVALTDSADTPVHVIAPPALLDHITEWDWSDGLIPDGGGPRWPMGAFRNRFLDAFSSGGAGRGAEG